MNLPPPLPVGEYPIGSMVAFVGTLDEEALRQTGWLYCNGNSYSRTAFADLYAVIGNNYGHGDGRSTFDVPDLRGFFMRGANNGKAPAADPDAATRTALQPGGNTGDKVGSVQSFATAQGVATFTAERAGAHTHRIPNLPTQSSSSAVAGSYQAIWNNGHAETSNAGAHAHNVSEGGDAETVPVNASVFYIIKFADLPA